MEGKDDPHPSPKRGQDWGYLAISERFETLLKDPSESETEYESMSESELQSVSESESESAEERHHSETLASAGKEKSNADEGIIAEYNEKFKACDGFDVNQIKCGDDIADSSAAGKKTPIRPLFGFRDIIPDQSNAADQGIAEYNEKFKASEGFDVDKIKSGDIIPDSSPAGKKTPIRPLFGFRDIVPYQSNAADQGIAEYNEKFKASEGFDVDEIIPDSSAASAGKKTPIRPLFGFRDIFPDQSNAEGIAEYNEKFKASEGFDVDEIKSDYVGMVFPIDLKKQSGFVLPTNKLAQMAIEIYNRQYGTNYHFLKVVKVNSQLIAGFKHYITFEAALDVIEKTGRVETFQAVGLAMVHGFYVESCRAKGK